jgi:hypothetical protein
VGTFGGERFTLALEFNQIFFSTLAAGVFHVEQESSTAARSVRNVSLLPTVRRN